MARSSDPHITVEGRTAPIGIGVVGAGAIAQVAHLPVLAKMRGVRLLALCDNDRPKARALADRFEVPDTYTDIEDLLEAEVIVVNTCGFIDAAKKESLDAIVEAGRMKDEGRCQAVVAVGCMCQSGAIGRARAGQDFRTILRTYYPGTTVGTIQ